MALSFRPDVSIIPRRESVYMKTINFPQGLVAVFCTASEANAAPRPAGGVAHRAPCRSRASKNKKVPPQPAMAHQINFPQGQKPVFVQSQQHEAMPAAPRAIAARSGKQGEPKRRAKGRANVQRAASSKLSPRTGDRRCDRLGSSEQKCGPGPFFVYNGMGRGQTLK